MNVRSWDNSEYVTIAPPPLYEIGGNNRQPLARLRLLKVYQNSTKGARLLIGDLQQQPEYSEYPPLLCER